MLEIPWPDPPILSAIIGALVLGFGAWLTWVASGASRLQERVADLESKMDGLWKDREKDALIKRLQGDHIDILENHIWTRKPPPPPARPSGI